MLNPKTLQRVVVLADVLEASRQPKDPIEAAIRSMKKASADADKAEKVAKK